MIFGQSASYCPLPAVNISTGKSSAVPDGKDTNFSVVGSQKKKKGNSTREIRGNWKRLRGGKALGV